MVNTVQKITKVLGFAALLGFSTQAGAQYSWSQAGPLYTAGRSRNMIVDKNDPSGNTLYVGSTSSGVFKSTNGGVRWQPLDDHGTVRNISYMAQGPDGTIYAATGEGFLRTGQKLKALPGTGIYKLSGNSLVLVKDSGTVGKTINRIAVSPANGAVIAVASEKGIMVSTDGGQTFNLANGVPTGSLYVGQDVKFDNTGILYCSIGNIKGPFTGTAATPPSVVYKANDVALSGFSNKTPTASVLADLNYGRIELAIAPNNNNIIYASCANKNPDGKSVSASTLKGFYVSYDGANTWALIVQGSPQLDPLSNGGTLASGDYAQTLLVSPNNPHQVFFGGYNLFVFTRTIGAPGDSDSSPIGTWQQAGYNFLFNTPLYLHENIHDVKIIPGNPIRFFFVTDAGIYRSTDLASATAQIPPSFQPFYKGLVTGQFNSVSIQRYPVGANATSTVGGTKVDPYVGFVGGTGGNGMTYYSGQDTVVTQETSYLSGDVYNTEFSKILPDAAFTTLGLGDMYRASNVRTGAPTKLKMNKYSGALSKIAPEAEDFANNNVTTGTPFKLWEYYGQVPNNPDYQFFYNDSIRFATSMSSVAELTTTSSFTIDANRPNRAALIDSVVIHTGTVVLPQTSNANAPGFTTGQQISIDPANHYYPNTGTLTTLTGSALNVTGPVGANGPTITLNNVTLIDKIMVNFANPPFMDKASTNTNSAAYYRVFATVFYRYMPGDTVTETDNNISTHINNYSKVLTDTLSWQYGSAPAYTLPVTANPAVTSPTYVVLPQTEGTNTTTSLPLVVHTIGVKQFSTTIYGNYSVTATPVSYSLAVYTDTTMPTTTGYSFVLMPGAQTKSVSATQTVVVFNVSPIGGQTYTITQTPGGTTTPAVVTNSTIGTTTFVLSPGAVTQTTNVFSLLYTPSSVPAYTINAISSNSVLGSDIATTYTNLPQKLVSTQGSTTVPFPSRNPIIKMQAFSAARLAVAMNHADITGGQDAIVVAKNPLALNDPLSFVRVSQSGAKTDDANGNATENTVVVNGRPTVLEWSKRGTEIFYATDANELYRVSHITDLHDLSQSSYSGKFFTDVFTYNPSGSPNSLNLNPVSPYRTTMIGKFDAPISSISVNKNDDGLVVTFNNPAGTGTTGLVVYSQGNIMATPTWVRSDNQIAPKTAVYCSMIEKDNPKKVLIGTDQGLYYTEDITSTPWVHDISGDLPNVQIFDIKQQVLAPWDCYNSGQIYAATNGRGVWINSRFLQNNYVGVNEYQDKVSVGNNLSLYPNPASTSVNLAFTAKAGEKGMIQVLDLSGRELKSQPIDGTEAGDNTYTISTDGLNPGIYLVNVAADSGTRRVAKLVVSR